MAQAKPPTTTIWYLQWLRALGAVSIVLLHAIQTVQNAAPPAALDPTRLALEEAVSVVCSRWAVPVFFMISGFLMLDPRRAMGWDKTLRHAWRLCFALLTFGLAFCVVEAAVDAGGLSPEVLATAVNNLLIGHSWDHMWYVYTLLGFYLLTPVIRPWVAQASREELRRVTLGLCVLLLGVRGAATFTSYHPFYNVLGLPYCFAYYFMGYYVLRYLRLERRWVVAGLASLAFVVVWAAVLGDGRVTDPIRGFVAPYAVLVALAAQRFLDRPLRPGSALDVLARDSFGIYLVHPAFQHLLVRIPGVLGLPAAVADALVFSGSLVLAAATVALLRRVPAFADKL